MSIFAVHDLPLNLDCRHLLVSMIDAQPYLDDWSSMATDKQINKYGLSRHIDENIARTIRKACGYGCVRCGMALYEYEHIDPEFAEAHKHNPERMALLCGSCHNAVTRKTLSKLAVKKARLEPWCLKNGYAHDFLELPDGPVGICLGSTRSECQVLLQIYGWPVIWF